VSCDPSIKSIIVKIDADQQHAYIVEDLDDQTLVIKENMLSMLKARLEDVWSRLPCI
jgi:TFIIH basal transcription factor complex TTD-A subunit